MQDFNLHNHTFRCHHAKGSDEDYVIQAIENGYKTIGFSDHAPYIFPDGYTSNFRVDLDMAQDYADSIKGLNDKYRGTIDVKLGYELEWYPELIKKELEFLKSFDYDYLICGQHYTGNEYEDWAMYTGHETKDPAQLERYIKQVLEAANSGEYAYIAHPDIINFKGDKTHFLGRMYYLIKELKKTGIPLEFNFLGYTDKRHYPNEEFWQMVAAEGNPVVIGLDAHRPEVYANKAGLTEAIETMHRLGLTPIENLSDILK